MTDRAKVMQFMPHRGVSHGFYDERGYWRKTKFCFMYCGDGRCDCGPPNGVYYIDPRKTKETKQEGT